MIRLMTGMGRVSPCGPGSSSPSSPPWLLVPSSVSFIKPMFPVRENIVRNSSETWSLLLVACLFVLHKKWHSNTFLMYSSFYDKAKYYLFNSKSEVMSFAWMLYDVFSSALRQNSRVQPVSQAWGMMTFTQLGYLSKYFCPFMSKYFCPSVSKYFCPSVHMCAVFIEQPKCQHLPFNAFSAFNEMQTIC